MGPTKTECPTIVNIMALINATPSVKPIVIAQCQKRLDRARVLIETKHVAKTKNYKRFLEDCIYVIREVQWRAGWYVLLKFAMFLLLPLTVAKRSARLAKHTVDSRGTRCLNTA